MSQREGGRSAARGRADRLIRITLDDDLRRSESVDIRHERDVAIYDLLEDNRFEVPGIAGPYELRLAIRDKRLMFGIAGAGGGGETTIMLSLGPFRRIVRDYFMVCESYYRAIRSEPPSRIEAIDMGRRALHDDGSRALQERLAGKAEIDFATARRLFTLISALHWKG